MRAAPAGAPVAHPYRGAAAVDAPTAGTGDAAVAWFIAGPGTKPRLHAGHHDENQLPNRS